MNYSSGFGLALFSLSVSSCAFAQEEPSFDCAKARTHVEKVLCSGGNSGMGDLDNTMANLYKAVSQSPGVDVVALKKSQMAWLAKRNKCQGSDTKVASCLLDSYRARYSELSSSYDKQHLTGFFSNKLGFIDSVLFPDGKLAVNISTNVGGPSYDSCSVTFIAPLKGASVQHTFTAEDTGVVDEKCTVNMNVTGSKIKVSSAECSTFCGNSATFDGVYKK